MHELIDDFAWVVIALVPITILFVIGAAFIFLDEGLRTLIRRLRNHPKAFYLPSETITSPARLKKPASAFQSAIAASTGSLRALVSCGRRALRQIAHAANSEMFPRLHVGHHKP